MPSAIFGLRRYNNNKIATRKLDKQLAYCINLRLQSKWQSQNGNLIAHDHNNVMSYPVTQLMSSTLSRNQIRFHGLIFLSRDPKMLDKQDIFASVCSWGFFNWSCRRKLQTQ